MKLLQGGNGNGHLPKLIIPPSAEEAPVAS